MNLLVTEYLKEHTFQQLEDEHGVCARPSSDGSKFSCNYDQILARSGDALAGQCRGLVIRPRAWRELAAMGDGRKNCVVGESTVLARPMDRFYNHGDASAAGVDWSDPKLRVLEKLDGTMVVVYWDPMKAVWCAGTRSVPEADLPIRSGHMEIGDMTFADLFWLANYETAKAYVLDRSGSCERTLEEFRRTCDRTYNREWTYVFELTSQWNRVIVKYDVPRITLLAVRETQTGREFDPATHGQAYMPLPRSWPLRDPAALAAFVDQADPSKLEGAVVIDSHFRRLKVKNKAWVLSSKAKDLVTVSRRSALEAIIVGTIDDVVPLLDADVSAELLKMQADLVSYCQSIDANFVRFRDAACGSRKAFAEQVTLSGDWTPAYFNLWEGKSTSALGWVRSMAERGKLSASSLDVLLARMGQSGPRTP